MAYILIETSEPNEVKEHINDEFWVEYITIDTMVNADKVEFLIQNIEKIDIDKLKELVK